MLVGMCALSLFLLNCGSSSSRPSGVLYVLTQGSNGAGNNVSSFAIDLNTGESDSDQFETSTCLYCAAGNSNRAELAAGHFARPERCNGVRSESGHAVRGGIRPTEHGVGMRPYIESSGCAHNLSLSGELGRQFGSTRHGCDLDLRPWRCESLRVLRRRRRHGAGCRRTVLVRNRSGIFSFSRISYPFADKPSCPHVPTSATDVCPSISVFTISSGTLTLAGKAVRFT